MCEVRRRRIEKEWVIRMPLSLGPPWLNNEDLSKRDLFPLPLVRLAAPCLWLAPGRRRRSFFFLGATIDGRLRGWVSVSSEKRLGKRIFSLSLSFFTANAFVQKTLLCRSFHKCIEVAEREREREGQKGLGRMVDEGEEERRASDCLCLVAAPPLLLPPPPSCATQIV